MQPTDPMVKGAIECVKDNLKASDVLLPTFFVGGKDGIQLIGAPFDDDHQKDMVAAVIRKIVAENSADFVLFISESWTIKDQEAAKDFVENRSKYPSVSAHPKAVEIVMIMLETKQRKWLATPDILPNRELGAVDWQDMGGAMQFSGRFSSFFPDAKPSIN